jgi:hypothetical protein
MGWYTDLADAVFQKTFKVDHVCSIFDFVGVNFISTGFRFGRIAFSVNVGVLVFYG